jgi:hypothetical protein
MKNHDCRHFGKWSALCAVAAAFAASGQACPPEMPPMPPMPASSLTGLWSGQISGDVTLNSKTANFSANPVLITTNNTTRNSAFPQLVFNEAGLPNSLPLALSAFSTSFPTQVVTAFNAGEMQTISNSNIQMTPQGTDTITNENSTTSTLTVMESVLSPDHFRVVYATTNIQTNSQTSAMMAFMPISLTQSSAGTLTLDATAAGDLLMFSMDFNNSGTSESTGSGNTVNGNGFVVGSLVGTLAAD